MATQLQSFLARLLTASLLISALAFPLSPIVSAETRSFSDVDETHPDFAAIEYLKETGTLEGEDGAFSPEREMNRAEFVKTVVAGQGIIPSVDDYTDCFPDVTTEWYAPYICYAKEQGWVSGNPDGLFYPANTINMVETMKIVLESQGLYSSELSYDTDQVHYIDVDGDQWYINYLARAVELELLEQEGAYLVPDMEMPRSDVSQQLFRARSIIESGEESYNSEAYDYALTDVELDEYLTDRKLLIANSYELDGAFIMTDDYYSDVDGVYSIESFSNTALLVVANSHYETTEGLETSDYSVDEDGVITLAEIEGDDDVLIFIMQNAGDDSTNSGDTLTIDDTEVQEESLEDMQTEEDIEQEEETEEEPEEIEETEEEEEAAYDDTEACLAYYELIGHTAYDSYRCEWSSYEGTASMLIKYDTESYEDISWDYGSYEKVGEEYKKLDSEHYIQYDFKLTYINVDSYTPDTSTTQDYSDYYWKDIYEYLVIDEITVNGDYSYTYDKDITEETIWYDGETSYRNTELDVVVPEVTLEELFKDELYSKETIFTDKKWGEDNLLLDSEGGLAMDLSLSLSNDGVYPEASDAYVLAVTQETYTVDDSDPDDSYSTYDEDEYEQWFNFSMNIRDEFLPGEYMNGYINQVSEGSSYCDFEEGVTGSCNYENYIVWEIYPEGYDTGN